MDFYSTLIIAALMFAASISGGLIVYLFLKLQSSTRRHKHKKYDIKDPANQLRFIEDATFESCRPINREAFRVFKAIEDWLDENAPSHRLLAEVSMGSFVKTERTTGTIHQRNNAFNSINSKRVDFLIIDPFGNPVVAIEYQGKGHFQSNATARDAVKKRALQKAGIFHEEVFPEEEKDIFLNRIAARL